MKRVVVTRDVPNAERNNFLGRAASKGEIFYVFSGPTYGCVDFSSGLALTESPDGNNPFFEFPADAVEVLP